MAKSDKQRALENFITSNQKKYGEEAARMNDGLRSKVEGISTGSILLDDALGIGGVARGRIIEIYGEEGSGKTSLCSKIVGNALKLYQDDVAGWIDVEHALVWNYAEQLGMDRDRVVFSQPSKGEQAMDELIGMCESGAFSVVVLDSVAGLRTKRQLEKELDEATIGEVARLMSNSMPILAAAAARTNTTVLLINQLRINIGAYGGPPTTMGGKAIKFFASQRINVKKIEVLVNKNKDPIGQGQRYIIAKNRMGIPFKEVETEFFFGHGFNIFKELIDLCLDKGLIGKGGAWFYPNPENRELKFQGKDKLIEYYSNNGDAFTELKETYKEFCESGLLSEVEEQAEKI